MVSVLISEVKAQRNDVEELRLRLMPDTLPLSTGKLRHGGNGGNQLGNVSKRYNGR